MISSCGRATAAEEVYMRSVIIYDDNDEDGLETEYQQFLPCSSRVCTVDKKLLMLLVTFPTFFGCTMGITKMLVILIISLIVLSQSCKMSLFFLVSVQFSIKSELSGNLGLLIMWICVRDRRCRERRASKWLFNTTSPATSRPLPTG